MKIPGDRKTLSLGVKELPKRSFESNSSCLICQMLLGEFSSGTSKGNKRKAEGKWLDEQDRISLQSVQKLEGGPLLRIKCCLRMFLKLSCACHSGSASETILNKGRLIYLPFSARNFYRYSFLPSFFSSFLPLFLSSSLPSFLALFAPVCGIGHQQGISIYFYHP